MRRQRGKTRRGLSLIESLMLVVILSIIGTTAGRGLLAITKIPSQADKVLLEETALVSKMEFVRALAYDNLTVGTAISPYSDGEVSVDVAYADPGGGATPDTNWKQVTVRLANGRQLTTYVSRP